MPINKSEPVGSVSNVKQAISLGNPPTTDMLEMQAKYLVYGWHGVNVRDVSLASRK